MRPPIRGATLSVSDSGVVEGSVAVPNVVLNGTVKGDILAHDRVELGATARVTGNVYYALIEMEMGAEINGKLIHEPRQGRTGPQGARGRSERREGGRAALDPEPFCPHADAMTPEAVAPSLVPTLVFTDAAAAKVGELIREEANPNLKLRVFVQGGGCSGFQYGFTFDENLEEGDTRVENGGVTLLIDPMSIQYLAGAEIDYREDIEGAQFVIRNPNASTTCGCGSSFST